MSFALFAEIFSVIAPLVVLAGAGWLWAARGKPFQVDQISLLVTNFGTPCLVIHALLAAEVDRSMIGTMALATLSAIVVFMAINAAMLRLMKLSVRDYVSGLTFPNAGNAGLSLSLFAYGQPGLALGIIFFAVTSLTNFTIGQSILAGRGNLAAVLRSPMIYAVLIGVAGNLLQLQPPVWVMRSLQTAGGIAIPLMLFTLGVSLATLKVNDLRRGLLLSALRLLAGLGAGFGLSWVLGLEGVARGVFIIQCAMPVAVVNYIFAVRYNRDPQTMASLVVISTLLSFATLPALLALVLG
ncbi:AEC family transporter [Ferrovibrio terrae]|uniref:AEC family transporter n=1 Tax=Ferrovibrio terrae TaxID=2594003 RepID=UPI003137F7CD